MNRIGKMKKVREKIEVSAFMLILCFVYLNFESVVVNAAAGDYKNDTIIVTQDVTSEITITHPTILDGTMSDMSPTIAGMSGGVGDGSASWTVVTNDTSGFNMKIKSLTSPALQTGSYSFADYSEAASGTPDFTWGISDVDSEFGFTVEPATASDTVQAFKDDGTICGGTGTANASNTCWDGLSTTDIDIINRPNITSATGETEIVRFRAQSGVSHYQAEGAYTATITVTATIN